MDLNAFTHVFSRPSEPGSIIDAVNPATGRSWINDQTLEQMQARYADAIIEPFDAWAARKAATQDRPIIWEPVNPEQYSEALDIIPPIMFTGYGFMIGEVSDHHALTGQPRYQAYRQRHGQHYASSRAITRAEMRAELDRYAR